MVAEAGEVAFQLPGCDLLPYQSLSGSEGTLGSASGLTGRGRSRGTRWALPAVEARESRVADESLGGPALPGSGPDPSPPGWSLRGPRPCELAVPTLSTPPRCSSGD